VKLIYNGLAGAAKDAPQLLGEILTGMQAEQLLPEVFMVQPDVPVEPVVRSAISRGIKLIVVAGGDGTVDSVAAAMVNQPAVLGILPIGTRNNLAFNLGIPDDVGKAIKLLRTGRRSRVDMGRIHSAGTSRWFLEGAALGLLADLYPVADDLQHGDVTQLGALLGGLVGATPSQVSLHIDGKLTLDTEARLVLIANMPIVGPRFQVAPAGAFKDGWLDVFVCSDMNTLELISYAVRSGGRATKDDSVKHYRAKHVAIRSSPAMTVLADGAFLPEGSVRIEVHPLALTVMAGRRK
jgi:YegS/Rv2252/BmrU family lipid kinase